MDSIELIERLSVEIQQASTAGDDVRARKLADLQLEVIARVERDMTADALCEPLASVPLARSVPEQEGTPL